MQIPDAKQISSSSDEAIDTSDELMEEGGDNVDVMVQNYIADVRDRQE